MFFHILLNNDMQCTCSATQMHVSWPGDSQSRKIFPNTNSPSCVTQAGFSSLMMSWYVASATNTDIHVSDQWSTSHFTFISFFEPPPYLLEEYIEHRARFLTLPRTNSIQIFLSKLLKTMFTITSILNLYGAHTTAVMRLYI